MKIVVVANYLKALSTVTAYKQKDFMIKAYCGDCGDSKNMLKLFSLFGVLILALALGKLEYLQSEVEGLGDGNFDRKFVHKYL